MKVNNSRELAAEDQRRAALRAILASPDGIAYEAGWSASRRSVTYDLDAAERRFETRYGGNFGGSWFSAGWADQASDYPKYAALAEHPAMQWTPATCAACGYMEDDTPSSRDNAHDNLCCGTVECSTPGECVTHDV